MKFVLWESGRACSREAGSWGNWWLASQKVWIMHNWLHNSSKCHALSFLIFTPAHALNFCSHKILKVGRCFKNVLNRTPALRHANYVTYSRWAYKIIKGFISYVPTKKVWGFLDMDMWWRSVDSWMYISLVEKVQETTCKKWKIYSNSYL